VGFLTLTVLNLVAAMQTMGIVLALGLFLLPAVSAYMWCDRFVSMLLLSIGAALLGSVIGILLSFHAGLASGAAIVLCLGAIFVVSALLSPRYGAIRALRLGRARQSGT
jgi:zinc/manganese transport system permease protein